MPAPVSLFELLSESNRSALLGVHTGIPARVERFDVAKQLVDVKPLVKKQLEDEDGVRSYEDFPVIPNVPIVFPRGSGFFFSFPIAVGDFVWLMFSQSSLAEWRENGQEAEPKDARYLSNGYPVAMPGCYPDSENVADALGDALVLGKDAASGQIHIRPAEIKIGKDASDFVALKTPTNSSLESLRDELNSLKSTFNSHMHTGVTSGPAVSGGPVAPSTANPSIQDVGATLTKAK